MSAVSVAAALALVMLLTAPDAPGAAGGGMTHQAVPILPGPAQLAGDWIISAAGVSVAVTLSARPAAVPAGAPAWTLEARTPLEAVGLGSVRAWRPAPDGIALVAADGATVAFFSTAGPDLYAHQIRSERITLSRKAG